MEAFQLLNDMTQRLAPTELPGPKFAKMPDPKVSAFFFGRGGLFGWFKGSPLRSWSEGKWGFPLAHGGLEGWWVFIALNR